MRNNGIMNAMRPLRNFKTNQCCPSESHWDCECETNYIRPKCVLVCPRCGAVSDECSDSRINEVFAALMASPDISNW